MYVVHACVARPCLEEGSLGSPLLGGVTRFLSLFARRLCGASASSPRPPLLARALPEPQGLTCTMVRPRRERYDPAALSTLIPLLASRGGPK